MRERRHASTIENRTPWRVEEEPVPSQLTFPDTPIDDPTRALIVAPSAAAGSSEDLERTRGIEIVDEIGTSAETRSVADTTEFDSVLADFPVGSWFG